MRTGAQLLVETILEQGIDMGFGVPGESYLAVLDAIHDTDFRFINTRQEGGAAFMAEAYGKLTGKPGVAFVTRGPGATNAAIGVHTAMQNSTPMVLFVGQIETGMRDREAFQELDYRAVFGSMAKWVVEIDSADRVPELTARAFSTAMSGRPGPVVVALPEDTLVDTSNARTRGLIRPIRARASDDDIVRVRDALAQASKPVLVVGGGGWNDTGREALQTFAEANDLPVIVTFRSQDLIDNHSPSYIGDASFGMAPAIRAFLDESDLILAVNVRFGETLTDGYTLFDPRTFDKSACSHPRRRSRNRQDFHADRGCGVVPECGAVLSGKNGTATRRLGRTHTESPHSMGRWSRRATAARRGRYGHHHGPPARAIG